MGSSSRKSMRAATNKDLEGAVSRWFLQQRLLGNPIWDPILCGKTKIIAQQLDCTSFKAVSAGENLSTPTPKLQKVLSKVVTDSQDPEFLYNADESGLIWKALPKTTSASNRECSSGA
ncbi:hypothetical protein QE152_g39113 [Popillia japonica]|uniref:Transposase n=1 Tax=Popillia japonica TaxID=7064 RepID=A0AAW1HUX3_POPJA